MVRRLTLHEEWSRQAKVKLLCPGVKTREKWGHRRSTPDSYSASIPAALTTLTPLQRSDQDPGRTLVAIVCCPAPRRPNGHESTALAHIVLLLARSEICWRNCICILK